MGVEIKFYTDTHVDKQVAIQLRLRDIIVVRCQEVGLANAPDETHLNYAVQNGYSVITKDIDFQDLHYEWMNSEKTHWGIFFCSDRSLSSIGKIVTECTTYYTMLKEGVGSFEDIINHFFQIC